MFELGDPDEEPGAGEDRLVLLVVTDHVAGVLAQEALDALAELLAALDVDLLHPVVAGLEGRRRRERRDLARLLVVERDVGDEVADDREGAQRRDGDRLALVEGAHARHAHQARSTVDLGAARSALAGLAVPADGEVRRLGGLEPVDDVEDDLALVDLDVEVVQLAVVVGSAPDPETVRCIPSGITLSAARTARPRSCTCSARHGRRARAARWASWAAAASPPRRRLPSPGRSGCHCRQSSLING